MKKGMEVPAPPEDKEKMKEKRKISRRPQSHRVLKDATDLHSRTRAMPSADGSERQNLRAFQVRTGMIT